MPRDSNPDAPWRRHLSTAERRKVADLDAEIATAQERLSALRRERAHIMRAANTRRYLHRPMSERLDAPLPPGANSGQ